MTTYDPNASMGYVDPDFMSRFNAQTETSPEAKQAGYQAAQGTQAGYQQAQTANPYQATLSSNLGIGRAHV